MKNSLILIFAISFLMYSCGKRCSGKTGNKGIILNDYTNDCSDPQDFLNGVIIENDSTLNHYFEESTNLCVNTVVDFNTESILGLFADGGCNVSYLKEVVKDDANEKYIYTVQVKECGTCDRLGISNNLVLVPKLPQNWTVEFIVK